MFNSIDQYLAQFSGIAEGDPAEELLEFFVVCPDCHQPMNGCGCSMTHLVMPDRTAKNSIVPSQYRSYKRIPVDIYTDKCHDCGAPMGATHHAGCDDEECPRCGKQLITCGCDVMAVTE